jgi:solute carrier family 39 (zinc transporter), member 7
LILTSFFPIRVSRGLLGDVFLHTLPEAFESASSNADHQFALFILGGFSLFLVVDMIMRTLDHSNHDHHHHHHSNGMVTPADKQPKEHTVRASMIALNVGADVLHNFTDGLAIGATFALSDHGRTATSLTVASIWSLLLSRGGLMTLSVLCHEIPHELGTHTLVIPFASEYLV